MKHFKELRGDIEEWVDKVNHIEMFREFLDCVPFAAWIKDPDFRMIWMNRCYWTIYPQVAANYLKATDFDVWPDSIAEEFRKNDEEVIKRGKPHIAIERDGGSDLLVAKFPMTVVEGEPPGVGGISIQIEMIRGLYREQ